MDKYFEIKEQLKGMQKELMGKLEHILDENDIPKDSSWFNFNSDKFVIIWTNGRLPMSVLVKFEDLAYSPLSGKVDFEKPCGLFRHKAIENLSKAEYNDLRNSTLESFDKVTDVLLDGKPYSVADLELMKSQLQRIVEPSLWSFYRILSPDFYTKYFTANGKD